MNYIKQLQREINDQEITIDRYNEGLQEIAGYLTSSKFYEDTTVQVQDVLNRLAELKSNANAPQELPQEVSQDLQQFVCDQNSVGVCFYDNGDYK